jgi:hypothetical protein
MMTYVIKTGIVAPTYWCLVVGYSFSRLTPMSSGKSESSGLADIFDHFLAWIVSKYIVDRIDCVFIFV